jgi:hypothetical protein
VIVQEIDARTLVLRDDLLDGGSKKRFLPYLVEGAREVVFGGPFCGGAPWALSVLGRESGGRLKVTLFYAKRKELHRRQRLALANGAKLVEVSPGYMTNVQAKARAYAKEAGALFLPLGFDLPAAEAPFVDFMRKVRGAIGGVDEVWCCAGSGMLARCLSKAFPAAAVHAVAVGLASRHDAQEFGPNVIMHEAPYRFDQEANGPPPPFPSCPNYDRKAWEACVAGRGRGRVLFWNVAA